MRIERHRVGEAAVAAAREGVTDRIGSLVHSMSKAGRMTTYEWWKVAEELLDHLGALSVDTPDLGIPEAKAVLGDATEAAAGAVAYAAYNPDASFDVFLGYVNFGMSYDRGSGAPRESVTAARWLDAFCLSILSDKASHHGEAFHFAREQPRKDGAGLPSVELINGLMAYVIGDTGDDGANHPPSREEKLAAVDAALGRIGFRDATSADALMDHPHSTGLEALRALAAADEETFRAAMVRLLTPHTSTPGPGAAPRSLLPLLPLALTALAYRREGWQPPVDTDYLPRALVTGFETAGPRVGSYGRGRRPDAVEELASQTVELTRPEHPQVWHPESEASTEASVKEAFAPEPGEPLEPQRLPRAMEDQVRLWQSRASRAGVAGAAVLVGRLTRGCCSGRPGACG